MEAWLVFRGPFRVVRSAVHMAKVQLTNVTVLDNPTAFNNPFQFEITFECLEDLADGESIRAASFQ